MKKSFNKNYFRELQIYSKEGSVKLPRSYLNEWMKMMRNKTGSIFIDLKANMYIFASTS